LRLARRLRERCGLSELSDGRGDTVKTHPRVQPKSPVVAVIRTEAILQSPHETQGIIEVGYVHAHHFLQNRLLVEWLISMGLPKTSMRQRLVIVASVTLVSGFSIIANGVFADQAGRDQLASQTTSYAVPGDPIPVRYLTPERSLAPTGPTPVGPGVAVGARPLPASRDSGLTLVLSGLSLFGGAVFMRRITPRQDP
jgi:hypothetical protein